MTDCELNGMNYSEKDLPGGLREVAEVIGLRAVLDLARLYGGSTLYIGDFSSIRRSARNRSIRADYARGCTVDELARAYRLAPRTVRYIVSAEMEQLNGEELEHHIPTR